MSFKINKKIILVFILLLAAGLRFYRLGLVPPSPNWDEVALGYNAHSLYQTGMDEYGARWPLILRSFDDYKPALYSYLAILPVRLFGLNVFAVRFVAAFLGSLAIWLIYLLVKEVFTALKQKETLALLAAFLLAISPWHLQFSRISFESNIGVFFNILLVWLFLKGLKKPIWLPVSAALAAINIYVYQAEKVFTPLLFLSLIIIFLKQLIRLPKKYLVGAVLIGGLLLIPFAYSTFTTPEIFLRAKGTSISADQTQFLGPTVKRLEVDRQKGDYLGLVLDNRRLEYAKAFVGGYLSHFNLNWLFLTGDQPRHHAPGMGLMYLWELPFLLWGIYSLVFKKEINLKSKLIILAWFLIAPLPAAFTTGVPHAVRTMRFLPVLQIFTALGLLSFFGFLEKQKLLVKRGLIIALAGFAIFNFAYFLNQYFVQQNYFYSQYWQYGYKQAVEKAENLKADYEQIVVSNQPHLDQSYMFFLFYTKYPPAKYQALGGTVSGGFAENHRGFDKYSFRPIDWQNEESGGSILYVGRPEDFGGGAEIIEKINFLDGSEAIWIGEKR